MTAGTRFTLQGLGAIAALLAIAAGLFRLHQHLTGGTS